MAAAAAARLRIAAANIHLVVGTPGRGVDPFPRLPTSQCLPPPLLCNLASVLLNSPILPFIQLPCHLTSSLFHLAQLLAYLLFAAGVHVVVGTPGRVFDMLRRRCLRADSIKMFVLDEADEMLSRGFKDQIYDIFQLLPPKLQVGLGFTVAAVGL